MRSDNPIYEIGDILESRESRVLVTDIANGLYHMMYIRSATHYDIFKQPFHKSMGDTFTIPIFNGNRHYRL